MGSDRRRRKRWRRVATRDSATAASRRSAERDSIQGQGRLGTGDCTEDAGLGLAPGQALAGETETGCAEEREEKADGGCQDPRPCFELLDGADQEVLAVMAEDFEADHGTRATTLPTGDRRARDVQSVAKRTRAGDLRASAGIDVAERDQRIRPASFCAARRSPRRKRRRHAATRTYTLPSVSVCRARPDPGGRTP